MSGLFYCMYCRSFFFLLGDIDGDWGDNCLLAEVSIVVNSPSTISMLSSEGVALLLSGAIAVKGVGDIVVRTRTCMSWGFWSTCLVSL